MMHRFSKIEASHKYLFDFKNFISALTNQLIATGKTPPYALTHFFSNKREKWIKGVKSERVHE